MRTLERIERFAVYFDIVKHILNRVVVKCAVVFMLSCSAHMHTCTPLHKSLSFREDLVMR